MSLNFFQICVDFSVCDCYTPFPGKINTQTNEGCIVRDSLPTRIDKTLEWLTQSRDAWKEKCKITKLSLKRQTFAIKRLKDSRDRWKLSCIQLKHKLSQSKETILNLQQQIQKLESQIEMNLNTTNDLKKKPSRL